MPRGGGGRKDKGDCEATGRDSSVCHPTTQSESEIINMDAVKKLISQSLEQQKSHFVEMLDRQADTFNKFVKVIMDSTNERLDAMNRNIQELKDSIHYTQKDVDEIKIKVPKLSMDHNTLENGFRKICDCLVTLESKADYLENQSRRNNLIFDGLKESFREKWEDTEKHVRKLISEKLNLDASAMAIERVHRVGKLDYKEERQRPRPIVVKFLNFKDRELVWRNRKELKTTAPGVYINEDFSEVVRQKRKELLPKLREAWDRGDIAYLKYDRLITYPPKGRHDQRENSVPLTSTPKTDMPR